MPGRFSSWAPQLHIFECLLQMPARTWKHSADLRMYWLGETQLLYIHVKCHVYAQKANKDIKK